MNKNEPAFPTKAVTRTEEGVSIEDCIGLTKREHFAGLAMQGLLANHQCHAFSFSHKSETVADMAREHADALLKALEELEKK